MAPQDPHRKGLVWRSLPGLEHGRPEREREGGRVVGTVEGRESCFLPFMQTGTMEVAVKVVKKEFFKQDPKVRENLEREIRIMKLLRGCDYVVRLLHVQVRPNSALSHTHTHCTLYMYMYMGVLHMYVSPPPPPRS